MADRSARRLLVIGAGALLFATSACDSSSSADTPISSASADTRAAVSTIAPEVTDATTAATTAPAGPASTVAASTPGTTVAVDGAALLSSALTALTTTYHFHQTITVDGATALEADGDHVGDGVRLALSGQGGVVNYIITPAGSWVMPDGGEWEQLDSAAATSDPIAALLTPSAVTVTAYDGRSATLQVGVAAASLGLAAGPDVSVTCELTEGVLQRVRFDSMVNGKAAAVEAVFSPAVDGSPVVAPV